MQVHPAWIEIDTKQFQKNIYTIRKKIGQSLFCLPVKANAYGHGLCEMAKIAENSGVDYLGVSCLQEGIDLRKAGIGLPILVFGAFHEGQIEDFIRYNLEFTISSKYKGELVSKKGLNGKCRVHIEVDTGMQRTGVKPESLKVLIDYVESLSCFEIVGVYSHLATSDVPNDSNALSQIKIFHELVKKFYRPGWIFHLANSGGVLFYPDSIFDMVRPGLLSYGYMPHMDHPPLDGIAPCFSLKAYISYFKVVEAGLGISYNHNYKTTKQTRIVTVPVGYGDGYRRALWNKASVIIREKKYPIAGTICMDQFMLDIGEGIAYVGDTATLIGTSGQEKILLWELAEYLESVPYEILCGFSSRLPRHYSPE